MIIGGLKVSGRIIGEIMLGTLVIAFLAGSFLAWKLSHDSIHLDKAIPYIETQINGMSDNLSVEIETLSLQWQGIENPLGLKAKNIVVSNESGPYFFAPEIDMNISLRSLLLGKFRLEAVWIRDIAISLTKTTEGQMHLTGHARSDDQEAIHKHHAIITLNDLIKDLPMVDVLWINNARVIYRDETKQSVQNFEPVTFFIEMERANSTKNMSGFLTVPFGGETTNNTVRVNFSTESAPAFLNISGSFKETPIDNFIQFLPALPDGWDLNMVVDATLKARLDNVWTLQNMDVSLNAPQGQIYFPLNKKDEMVGVSDLKIHLIQEPQTDVLSIENLSLTINEKVGLNVSGAITHPQKPDHMSGNLNMSLTHLPQSYFTTYWPKDFADNGAYKWLAERIKGGIFTHVQATTVFDMGQKERSDNKPLPPQLLSVQGDFAYEGLEIDYNKPMAAATQVSGTGKYDDISLTLNIDQADIGGMTTIKAHLYFDDLLTKGSGLGTLTFPITAPTQAVFDYIAAEPIQAFKHVDFQPTHTKGDVDAVVTLKIPLLKDVLMDDIEVAVKGTINHAHVPNAVKDLTLSGGPYDIFATAQEIKLSGSGQLSGKPITLNWHEYFSSQNAKEYVSKITAQATANTVTRRAFTKDFADYFTGDTTADLTYIKYKNGQAKIDLALDLEQTNVFVPEFGLNKKSGIPATANLDIHLYDGDLTAIKNLAVKGAGLSLAQGEMSFRTVGGEPVITKGSLKNMIFNENRLSVLMAEQDGLFKTNVTGTFLDARPILEGKKKEKSKDTRKSTATDRATEIGVDVLEMRTSDAYTIKNPKAYIRMDTSGQAERFEMDAKLGDKGQYGELYVRYTPDVADGLTLRVESNNAGETLRAFDLYPYIKGGQLQIAGVPLEGGYFGDVRGQARINDFAVAEAPVLLRLINALSFQNFLRAGVLEFSRLESDFEWMVGDDGDVYKISNGRTSGASVALTFDGFIDTAQSDMHVKGTAAPLSDINKFIGKIPIIGDILTGGDALLAATYSIKGDPSDPSVSVNPLSVLAPGIIRKMLFESTPEPKDNQSTDDDQQLQERSELN